MKRCLTHPLLALCLLVLCMMVLPSRAFSSPDSPNLADLRDGWRMTSAKNVTAEDSQVSQPTFDASSWYPAEHMPATVLQMVYVPEHANP